LPQTWILFQDWGNGSLGSHAAIVCWSSAFRRLPQIGTPALN
jgi:hypothetical protein